MPVIPNESGRDRPQKIRTTKCLSNIKSGAQFAKAKGKYDALFALICLHLLPASVIAVMGHGGAHVPTIVTVALKQQGDGERHRLFHHSPDLFIRNHIFSKAPVKPANPVDY